MMRIRSDNHTVRTALIWTVFALGIAMRMLVALRGHNYDVNSYRIIADIVSAGGNVYAETTRYNYGPIWLHILHYLDLVPFFGAGGMDFFRLKVAGFLTIVDLGIFFFILRRYSLLAASLFLLNPISIIITGYHSQFDNLAVFLALVSIDRYADNKKLALRLSCLTGIGLSLCVKHILFAFPLWLAFKERTWSKKLLVLLVPYTIFLLGFLYYIPEGLQGIIQNVFLYKSFDNAPFWAIVVPHVIFAFVPKIVLFLGALVLVGFLTQEKTPTESLHLYLISLVVFSSAMANQYLSIPIPSVAVLWNWCYALYSFFGGLYLTVEGNGLHISMVRDVIGWGGSGGYYLLVLLLALGLCITLCGQQRITKIWHHFVDAMRYFIKQIRSQLSSRW